MYSLGLMDENSPRKGLGGWAQDAIMVKHAITVAVRILFMCLLPMVKVFDYPRFV